MQTLVQPTANITPFTPHYKIKRTKSPHDLWEHIVCALSWYYRSSSQNKDTNTI